MISALRRAQYERRAAQLGMTLVQFLSYLADEEQKQAELYRLTRDRDVQFEILRRRAQSYGNMFLVFTEASNP